MRELIYVLDLFGVAIFAITGSLAAGKKRMDLFGVVVLATVTALGGGTVRDMILDIGPAFWVTNPTYLIVVVTTAITTFLLVRIKTFPTKALIVADAIGLAVFTIVGTEKAINTGVSGSICVVMGVTTGVFGGMVRDVLAGEIPLILRREIYATASLCGAIVFYIIFATLEFETLAVFVSFFVILILRFAAIKWNISLPILFQKKKTSEK
jgi:uncharacterized membrane protein YeiH